MTKGFLYAFSACVALLPAWVYAEVRPLVVLSTGVDVIDIGRSQDLTLLPPFENKYVTTKHSDQQLLGGGFVGFESNLKNNWAWQLGLAYYQDKTIPISGNVVQDTADFSDPSLDYNYSIANCRVLLESKLLYNFKQQYHPYAIIGAGQGWNRSYGYTEQPIDTNNVPMLQSFASRSTRTFTYEVGAGLDYDVNSSIRVGGGYRFADLGAAKLGISSVQATDDYLQYKHLYSNQVVFQISSFIG